MCLLMGIILHMILYKGDIIYKQFIVWNVSRFGAIAGRMKDTKAELTEREG